MGTVELSAGTIEYEDTGGDGPVIVFSHGLMMDGSLWRHVVSDLREDHRCVLPTLPLGSHRHAMSASASMTMGGIAGILGEFIEALELDAVTLAMSDWGGPQLLVGSRFEPRIARLVICSCEAFDNVPPEGPARMLPRIARIPGGLELALVPFRFDRLRRLPMTYGLLSRRPVPREVMDRWFAQVKRPEIRRDLRRYVLTGAESRAELLAASDALARFERPALIVWAREDRMMPPAHARRLAELLPQSTLVELDDCLTLISEDRPDELVREIRAFERALAPSAS